MQVSQLAIHGTQGLGRASDFSWMESLAVRFSAWLNQMVGCRHKELSRPFSSQGQTYRVCVSCGARRAFNVGRWEMHGRFYYSRPTSKQFGALSGLAPRRASNRLAPLPMGRYR